MWSIHGLHCAGVVHSNIRCSNMHILTNNGLDLLYVTLFDFSDASPKFNHLNRLTPIRHAGWFVIVLLCFFS
jgi:hypothetical protein